MTRRKICVLIVSGTLETSLHPVPPVADGAPEWNVFRLAEAASLDPGSQLEIHVVSPCEAGQLQEVQAFPVQERRRYHHMLFGNFQLGLYRQVLRHIWLLRAVLSRLVKLPDVLSWRYLMGVVKLISDLQPDIVIINDRPQYIAYLRNKVAKGKLFYMVRARIGDSRRFLKLLDGIIVNSRGMKEYVEQFFEIGTPPVWQIPNALGSEFSELQMPTDRFVRKEQKVLYSGRLIPDKGVRELLLAFRLVHEKIPQATLIVLGVGEKSEVDNGLNQYEKELYALASEYPPGVISFLGYIPNHQMAKHYQVASVAVFPSMPGLFESFGMVALEAMRCGTPVVASRQPGFEELVIPGETGLLVEDPRNVEALAQAVLSILQDSELAQRMGQAGYQRSLDYTPEKGLQSLEMILQNYLV